jgi:hypothetical protein
MNESIPSTLCAPKLKSIDRPPAFQPLLIKFIPAKIMLRIDDATFLVESFVIQYLYLIIHHRRHHATHP